MAKIQIALNLPQFMGWDDLIERTAAAERFGFHSVWTCDHMWPPADRGGDQLEVLTTMAAKNKGVGKTEFSACVTRSAAATQAKASAPAETADLNGVCCTNCGAAA